MENVETKVVYNSLCSSCGICKAVCPKKCIVYQKRQGQYVPKVDMDQCIHCGLCLKTCPGIGPLYEKDLFIGDYLDSYIGYYQDETLRKNSTSGGMISGLINDLLKNEDYDCAFVVDTFRYDKFVTTHQVKFKELNLKQAKSRYISVSMENLVSYMIQNKKEKIIVVAVGCAIQGILKVIEQYHLTRKNYLILGLFCDKVFSYNIYDYFNDLKVGKHTSIDELIFRTKEKNGWPGDMKLTNQTREAIYCSADERKMVKDYFALERCMYCLDKLNCFSDISFGDNYTNHEKSKEGSNSIIVRTEEGKRVLERYANHLHLTKIEIDDILSSQKIKNRNQNLKNATILFQDKKINLYPGFVEEVTTEEEDIKKYHSKLKKMQLGKEYPETKSNIKKILRKKRIRLWISKKLKRKRT